MRHCSDETLLSYQDGELDDAETGEVRDHLSACWQCRARLAELEEQTRRLAECSSRSTFPGAHWRQEALERLHSSIREWEPSQPAAMPIRLRNWIAFRRRGVGVSILRSRWVLASVFVVLGWCVLALFLPRRMEARALLLRSAESERRRLNTVAARHRVWEIEERSSGQVMAHRHVDLWQGPNARPSARRVFDEHQHLVAGEWISKNGVPTVYLKSRHDAQPSTGAHIPHDLDEAALLNFSAAEFLDLAGAGTNPQASAGGSGWTIQVHAANSATPADTVPRLLRARLVLSGADLHPTEEEFVIGASNRQLEYHMRETSLEVFTKEAPPPLLFAQDPLPTDVTPEPETSASNPAESGLPAHSAPRSKPLVNIGLEVDVLSRLPFANLVLGRQARLERRPDGGLELLIVAGSDQEKNRIVKDLGSMLGEPQLVLRFQTPAEFGRDAAPAIDSNLVIVPPEVRSWVADKFVREGLTAGETEVARRARAEVFAILENAERMQAHNRALREVAGRFDQKQIDSLDADQTSRWLAVWSQYLGALQIEATSLLNRLTPIFGGEGAVSNANSPEVTKDTVFSALWEVTGDLGRLDLSLDRAMLTAQSGKPRPPMQNVCQQLQAAIARLSAVRAAVER